MKKLLLCGIIGAMFVSANSAFATDDISKLLTRLNGFQLKSTPVKKTEIAKTGPNVAAAVSKFAKSNESLSNEKNQLVNEVQLISNQKSQLETQVQNISNEIDQKKQSNKELLEKIEEFKKTQKQLLDACQKVEQCGTNLEVANALKSSLANFLVVMRSDILKNIGENDIVQMVKIESSALTFLQHLSSSKNTISILKIEDSKYKDELKLFEKAKSNDKEYPDLSSNMKDELKRGFEGLINSPSQIQDKKSAADGLLGE